MDPELERKMWQCIGLQGRITRFERDVLWPALVEQGRHITIYADEELIGVLDLDFSKEEQT